MTVDSIMSRDIVTVGPEMALRDIRALFHEHDSHHLLVVEDGLLGVISDRDVLRALSPFLDSYSATHHDVQTVARPAREIMRAEHITVAPTTSIEEAADQLLAHDISALPVVEGKTLVGLVTTTDLLRHYTNGR